MQCINRRKYTVCVAILRPGHTKTTVGRWASSVLNAALFTLRTLMSEVRFLFVELENRLLPRACPLTQVENARSRISWLPSVWCVHILLFGPIKSIANTSDVSCVMCANVLLMSAWCVLGLTGIKAIFMSYIF